jgi:hypothetical protein
LLSEEEMDRLNQSNACFHLSGAFANQIKKRADDLTVPDVLAALVNVTSLVIVRSSADPIQAREKADAFAAVFEQALIDRLQQRGWR